MNMKKQNWNRYILEAYSERPVAFIPVLARISGTASAGLFMSQMLYWCGKGYNAEWVYKTINEMEQETCLSRSEQERAITKWIMLGVLDKEVRGIPPKRHFRIKIPTLEKLLDTAFQIGDYEQTNCSNKENTITENTFK
jgi:hypothetical protein